ncbi:hypothetical protein H6B07_17075 [Mediterraneibacter glycyrrhizinilyticus]|nr:hypothetical protein [Mediterraneibacter glycyrrhizinilyticus]HJB94096.1 hypothetical protein [Candidatus Mediterraneibacter intestinigallinarum]
MRVIEQEAPTSSRQGKWWEHVTAIKKDESGNVTWQDGGNRTYTVPATGAGQISINW